MSRKKESAESEADGGVRVPHPRETCILEGHEQAEADFLQVQAQGRLHHAWLLTGEPGIGKASFAYCAARFLIAGEGAAEGRLSLPESHPVSRQIAAGAHPSLFVLERDPQRASGSGAIAVEDVRRLGRFLRLTSGTERRAVIVDTADDLTGASANALLKALEEPPPGAVFFLISRTAGGVIATIRSRCAKLHLRPLASAPFRRAVNRALPTVGLPEPDEKDWQEIERRASGSPGRALALLTSNLRQFAGEVEALLQPSSRPDAKRLHRLIEAATSGDPADFTAVCDLIEETMERRVREAASRAESTAREAQGLARYAELWEKVRARRRDMESLNLDKAAYLFQTFTDIASSGPMAGERDSPRK